MYSDFERTSQHNVRHWLGELLARLVSLHYLFKAAAIHSSYDEKPPSHALGNYPPTEIENSFCVVSLVSGLEFILTQELKSQIQQKKGGVWLTIIELSRGMR